MRPNRTFSWYLENRLFYLYLILLTIYLVMTGVPVITQGLNRTVGWKWLFLSIDFIITYYTLGFYLIGLMILLIFRRNTGKTLSKLYLLGLLLIFIWDSVYAMNYAVVGYFKIFVFLLFLILAFTSESQNKARE